MTMREWWLVMEQHRGTQRYGRLSENEASSLQHTLRKAKAREATERSLEHTADG